MKQIPIFFSFNNNYVIPAAVAFYSLLNKAKSDVAYKMYVLHSNIDEKNQNLLLSITNKFDNSTLEFINTKGFLSNEWNNGNWEGHNKKNQFTTDTIVKCFAAGFFPEFDKIIYSDVDILVTDDISVLYDIDLTDKYIGAVKSPFLKYKETELSHLSNEIYNKVKDTYFGGGIWVMNLKKIREDNLEEKMINIIKDDSITKRWPDQDIMNIVCDNKVEFLPLNYISYPYLPTCFKDDTFISHYTREELYDSMINPKIIHWAGPKPWNSTINLSQLWFNVFDYLNIDDEGFIKIPKNNIGKKYKKYRKLFNIFLITSIILFIIIILLI